MNCAPWAPGQYIISRPFNPCRGLALPADISHVAKCGLCFMWPPVTTASSCEAQRMKVFARWPLRGRPVPAG